MSGQADPSGEGRTRAVPAAPGFNLAANPFAILGATPRTSQAELQELAARAATPAAAAATRVLTLPRSRLGAEVSFLPGAAEAAPVLLATLARGERPLTLWLPPTAQANVLAHLCAAGQATAEDRTALVASQSAPGDPALADAINSDRAIAGIPPLQPAALRAEQDGLADLHAAAVVTSCLAGSAAAAELAALVRGAAPGPPRTIMRRAAAAWARGSAAELAAADDAASAARDRLRGSTDPGLVDELGHAIRSWAALDAPQRAADAQAGLDHEPALAALKSWRAAAASLALDGRPDLGLRLAQVLADTFGDLPGEVLALQDQVRALAGQVEDQALEQRLAPLRALADRLGTEPSALQADLAKRPFGPGARGVAGELWSLFDAACQASVASDAPWTIIRALVLRIGGPWHRAGAPAAIVLQRGLIERAGTTGRTALMTVLAAEQRGLVEAALTHDYETKLAAVKGSWLRGLVQRRAALAALRKLLPAVTDPVRRADLAVQERTLAKRKLGGWRMAIIIASAGSALVRACVMDSDYAQNAPYRQSVHPAAAAPDGGPAPAPLPTPFHAAPSGSAGDAGDGPVLPKLPAPLPPSAKFPDAPAEPASAPRPAFPRHEPREVQPLPTNGPLTRPEATWCVFNDIRLRAAEAAAPPRQLPGVLALRANWQTLCKGGRPIPPQINADLQLRAGLERGLAAEGRALLRLVP